MASLYSSALTSLLLACTCFTYGLSVLFCTYKFVAGLYMLYIWPLCTLLHLQVCCLLVHALHKASLYSSALTSLLLACTCFTYGLSVLFCTYKFVAGLYMLYIWPLCTLLHLQVCCLLVHALHKASLYSSALTSLLLACTCFTYGLSVLFCTYKFAACLYMLYIWPLCTFLHLQVCCLLVHALHMASLYSSALTSLLLACTCFVMFFIQ